MPIGASSWSFTEEDFSALTQVLQRFLFESNARCALLVDRSGQLVTFAGDRPTFDVTAFATLTAADFSANDQLARLIGESDFNTLFHQGEKESMLLADVVRRVILVALFDNRTTLGLVRLKMRAIVDDLGRLIERSLQRSLERSHPSNPQRQPLLGDVDDEIDRLFQ
ncbi:MAG TPA: roadblock/LC7 domain-containing protein [Gemmatimonadaceae bacterium]|nr:roadblock/LC7 domain-containing protein [Gemmatimonadaceae bacterium]